MIDTLVLRKLEFEKVLNRISAFAVSEPAKESIRKLIPLHDVAHLRFLHQQVSEAKELIAAEGSMPFDDLKDLRPTLKKLAVENQSLTAQDLLDVAAALRSSRNLHGFLLKRKATIPSLVALVDELMNDKVVEYNISSAIDDHGNIKDSASKELRAVRHGIASAGDALRKRLQSILRGISDETNFLQDEIITTRDGRLVIPVKSEFKNRVPGFIHSSSASGSTVYIEPAESLDLNNNLRELQLREQQEILRILRTLTEQVIEIRDPLGRSFAALVQLDFISAKAKYSIDIVGFAPEFSAKPAIGLENARHPGLLQQHTRSEVVPLNLKLGDAHSTLVITGPNAGGKTITLKTVGLLALCAMSGIHISASPESILYPFDSIFVDIGDDQSIEQDLSTFSSHLAHLRMMLDQATPHSLILLDEIGSGTDPAEGGGLAIAFLQEVTSRGSLTIATTHHGALKAFAHETDGVMNGSMEFDQSTLTPTYHFRAGIPGSSYAFELAERIGFSRSFLAKARSFVGDERMKLESLIVHLEQQSQAFAQSLEEADAHKVSLENEVKSYEQKNAVLRREVGTIRKKAAEEAATLIETARGKIEETIKAIRESNAGKEVVQSARQVLKSFNDRVKEVASAEQVDEMQPSEEVRQGDFVRLRDGNEVGRVIEVKGSLATVEWGNATLRVKHADLRRAQKSTTMPEHRPASMESGTVAKTEIDLRGLLGTEAITQTQSFLDTAYSAGLHRVDIIHGKGTGALRKHIAEFLKGYPHIKSFRLGEWNEGGSGVTVVEFQ